ncbi:MAG: DUF1574 family protein [Spirochaetia bacterium]|nr:DUF1574 family protein [Spirochaetia bacterium]
MDLFKNKFLWIPPLALVAVLLLDKIFLLPPVLEYTVSWMKIEPPFYRSREPLLEQLAVTYPGRKARGERLGVILGTSRTGEFSTETFARHIPKSYTYNFSAPLGCPSYHYYWLDRMLKAGALPAYVVVEAEPIMFTQNAISYSLSYSYDPVFVFSHIDWNRTVPRNVWDMKEPGFSFDESETYFLKRAGEHCPGSQDGRGRRGLEESTPLELQPVAYAALFLQADHPDVGRPPDPHSGVLAPRLRRIPQKDSGAGSLEFVSEAARGLPCRDHAGSAGLKAHPCGPQ